MGFNPENCKNHAALNTIIMAVKKKICFKERLKTHDPATIKIACLLTYLLTYLQLNLENQ